MENVVNHWSSAMIEIHEISRSCMLTSLLIMCLSNSLIDMSPFCNQCFVLVLSLAISLQAVPLSSNTTKLCSVVFTIPGLLSDTVTLESTYIVASCGWTTLLVESESSTTIAVDWCHTMSFIQSEQTFKESSTEMFTLWLSCNRPWLSYWIWIVASGENTLSKSFLGSFDTNGLYLFGWLCFKRPQLLPISTGCLFWYISRDLGKQEAA